MINIVLNSNPLNLGWLVVAYVFTIDIFSVNRFNLDMTITSKDLDEIENRLSDVFVTKEDFTDYKSELFNKLDDIVKNTSDTNQEVELIENRVTKIETKLQLT